MRVERIHDPVVSARFQDVKKELIDLDFLFKDANKFFSRYFLDLGVVPDFDFSDTYNKKLYTNEFIRTVCDWMKDRTTEYSTYFYWNNGRDDKFKNSLVKKLKTLFGFKIWEDSVSLDEFITKIEKRDCSTVTGLEVFLDQDNKLKNFKSIRRHLEKTGMNYLQYKYFEDLENKMILFR
jgi:hypothetical protein